MIDISDCTTDLKCDLIDILSVIKMVSRELFEINMVENTLWLIKDNKTIGYITLTDGLNFTLYINHNDCVIRKYFKERNDMIIYLKKDFISEFIARLI